MSRSKPQEAGLTSPVQKYLEYHGGRGNLFFYDKDAKKNVEFENAEFILLDSLSSVTGWHKTKETNISSNLVKNLKSEELKVITLINKNNPKITTVAEGFWNEDFKKDVNAVGGDFTANLFGLLKSTSGWTLVRLELNRANLGSWSNFTSDLKKEDKTPYDGIIKITRSKIQTKGGIKYYTPVFTLLEIDQATEEAAIEADKTLQLYFDDVKARKGLATDGATDEPAKGPVDTSDIPTPEEMESRRKEEPVDDLPF